jgi:hypothetical protein
MLSQLIVQQDVERPLSRGVQDAHLVSHTFMIFYPKNV